MRPGTVTEPGPREAGLGVTEPDPWHGWKLTEVDAQDTLPRVGKDRPAGSSVPMLTSHAASGLPGAQALVNRRRQGSEPTAERES